MEWPKIFTIWIFRESFPNPDTDHSNYPRDQGGGGVWGGSPGEAIPELRHKECTGDKQTRLRSQGRPRQEDSLFPDKVIRDNTASPGVTGVCGSARAARSEMDAVAML